MPNVVLAEKIIKGEVSSNDLKSISYKRFYNNLLGKNTSEVTIERFILRKIRDAKKASVVANEERQYYKFKKEPEKNITHWDHLLNEMKWMASDFEKEKRIKKRNALDYIKYIKKHQANKHIEELKSKKRLIVELKKRANNIAKTVNIYWKKIGKINKYEYEQKFKQEQALIKQQKLVNFINKLQRVSGKVAESISGTNNNNNSIRDNVAHISNINMNINSPNENFNNLTQNINFSNEIEANKIVKLEQDGLENNENNEILENNDIENENKEDYSNLYNNAQNAQIFQPKGFDLAHCSVTLEQPFLIKFPLREYQLIGLNWLSALHDNKINGILADEMGLGKTIQTISLIAHLACNKGIWGPHLIVVPTTIILNWEIEFKKWCPSLKILSYYGTIKERKQKRHGWHKPNSFNVCITSYKLVIQDFANFKRKKWYYIILDEAQNIKNFKSKRWQMIVNFNSKRKLLLSGTPLQNDIMEIWSYLHFLMPNIFNSNEEFRDWFYGQFKDAIEKNSSLNKKLLNSLHSILRPFLLRRLKKDVEKQLPGKKEHIIKCDLTRRQKYLYDEYINNNQTQITLQQTDYFSIMNILMQLKKVCNHPDLFEARDYHTPFKLQLFNIEYIIPYLIYDCYDNSCASLFHKYKLISMLRSINLLFLENERFSIFEYLSIVKNFPTRKIYKIHKDFHKNKIKLQTPCFTIKEDDILFKQQYTDSTIFYNSNTENKFNLQNLYKTEENLFDGDLKEVSIPHYLCPTNIPLLKDNSLLNFFDIYHPNENRQYLYSFFKDNIRKIDEKKYKLKNDVLKKFDEMNRKVLLSLKPIYGYSLNKILKLTFSIDGANSKNIIFDKGIENTKNVHLQYENIINSQIMKKGILKLFSENRQHCISRENNNNRANQNIKMEIKEEIKDEIKMEYKIESENFKEENTIKVNNCYKCNKVWEIIKSENLYQENPFPSIENNSLTTPFFINSNSLNELLTMNKKYFEEYNNLIESYSCYIPKVIASCPRVTISKVKNSHVLTNKKYEILHNNLLKIPLVMKFFSGFKIISCPDKLLVEYDSGKLIKLAGVLKTLRRNKSKCLIFTQMTKMLDILEKFLNIHGYTYVRLDGSTKIEMRQAIVDKFNNDSKVFCFISSTRSGGIGLNLTGADSIIFYDTDWNPAMDKQAQDRCHRIGQTREVNIYRFITNKTIEENIFKKSIQKRELSHIVMEEGEFTIDTLKENKIDFKNVLIEEGIVKVKEPKNMMDYENLTFENEEDQKNIEQMLIKIEDKEDVQAYKHASLELLNNYQMETNEQMFIASDENVNFILINFR